MRLPGAGDPTAAVVGLREDSRAVEHMIRKAAFLRGYNRNLEVYRDRLLVPLATLLDAK